MPSPLTAQPVLTGASLFTSSETDGAYTGGRWNTGGPSDDACNLYFYSGTITNHTFLNSGDTDDSLNPKLRLSPGVNVINFGASGVASEAYGLNLFFDDSTTNAITVYAKANNEGHFGFVERGLPTYGWKKVQPSAGTLTLSRVGELTVALSDFRVSFPAIDLVSCGDTTIDGRPDIVGSFTLTVVPPASLLASIEVSEISVSWFAKSNTLYQLQYRSEETTNLWTNLKEPVRGEGGRMCIKDPVIPNQRERRYQIVELP